jgi:hypothetical protein
MATTTEVIEWVRTATKQDLDMVKDYIQLQRTRMGRTFQPGDKVKFDGGRSRGMIYGTFVKVMQKNAEVLSNGMRWRVNPALLEADDRVVPAVGLVQTPAPPAGLAVKPSVQIK